MRASCPKGVLESRQTFHFEGLAWNQKSSWTSETMEDMDNACLSGMKWKVHIRDFLFYLRFQRPWDNWGWGPEVEGMN